jgi:hypothetical protein
MEPRQHIAALTARAIGDDGFISLMARQRPSIATDVPAAFEMYALLEHGLGRYPFSVVTGAIDVHDLRAGVRYDQASGRLLALVPVGQGELPYVAHWISNQLLSERVRAMPGLLALPFAVEQHDGQTHLLPEWFCAYYVDGMAVHCVPLLALKSVVDDERFDDWVGTAIARMDAYGLPRAKNINYAEY